jgi:UDP-GlcNAc:undecaprenyl-phosphate/decaprenyl-phosphate GlcNAc-1-phosphate transferase
MIFTNLILILFIIFNLILIINFSKIKLFHFIIDKPDKIRKFHRTPTPLAGGQIIFLNILLYWIFLNLSESLLKNEILFHDLKSLNYFMTICSAIFFLGFLDDKYNLKANLKFLILSIIISTLLLVDFNLIINDIRFSFINKNFILSKVDFLFTIFCFLVFINAFNMFDGINLQSSIYSLFIFFCILFFFSNSILIKILIITLICFSYLNFRNKSFLGDSGTLLLAFIISYFFIILYNFNYIEFADEVVLYMLIPGLDLARLFIFRILKKKNPLSSDRHHLHHLLLSKYSLSKTLILISFLISFPIVLNYFTLNNVYTILISFFNYTALITFLYVKN